MANEVEVQVPIGGGLDTKKDPRLVGAPNALTLKNAAFDESGGIQTRNAYSERLHTTPDGGTTLTNIRRLQPYGDELLCFTKTKIYSWTEVGEGWIERAEYLAPKLSEKSVFIRNTEQTLCDRVETGNVIIYTWLDGSTSSSTAYLGAIDKTTGAILLSPTSLGANTTRPRLVYLSGQNGVLLFAQTAANTLSVKVIDASDATFLVSSAAAAWTSVGTTLDGYYDVTPLAAASAIVVWRRTVTTSYAYATVALAGSAITVTASTKARTCDGPIAVAVTADGTKVAVIRADTTNIVGDILTSALVDSSVGNAIGSSSTTATSRIAAAFRSVANSGQFRCYVWWANAENAAALATEAIEYNYIDTAGAVGSEASFLADLRPVSRAFDHDGSVYVWMTFAQATQTTALRAQIQNTYFLVRDDATIHAKAAAGVAGGFQALAGYLPGVQTVSTGVYAFCGGERRVIPLGGEVDGYADRGPRDIVITFDSDEARRCVQLGKTLYIAGAEILQYDGTGIAEVGFHVPPWYLAITAANAGSIEAGDYSHKAGLRWDNAKGEIDRSATVCQFTTTIAASKEAAVGITGSAPTKKTTPRAEIAVELWRTLKNPNTDAAYYLTTSKTPTATGDNGFFVNSRTAQGGGVDDMVDATLATKETSPENSGALRNFAPPAATIIAASEDRLFLAGISSDPLAIWYSKQRGVDEVAAFNPELVVRLPALGGDITGLAFLNTTLVVFKESAVYFLAGTGFDNALGGSNYGPAQIISTDVGATSHDLIASIPNGLLFFSQKGWYQIDRGFGVPRYIGEKVEDYNTDSFHSVVVLDNKHQIRCASSSRILMFDYQEGAWSEWEEASSRHTCLYGVTDTTVYNPHWYCTSSAIYREGIITSPRGFSLTYKSPWIKVGDLALGTLRVKHIGILGEYRSAHDLKVELFRDYGATAFQTKQWTVSPTTVGNAEIVRHAPSIRKMGAVQIQITTKAVGLSSAPTGEAVRLTGLTFRLSRKRGLARVPAAQKQ